MILLEQGLTAMIVGMLIVFAFLVLLVYAMKIMSYVITRWFPEPEEPTGPVKKASPEAEIAAAIAAVTAFKHS